MKNEINYICINLRDLKATSLNPWKDSRAKEMRRLAKYHTRYLCPRYLPKITGSSSKITIMATTINLAHTTCFAFINLGLKITLGSRSYFTFILEMRKGNLRDPKHCPRSTSQ